MNPVGTTSLLVAAMRAEESARPDRLFEDPLADALAGPMGRAALAEYRAAAGAFVPIIEVRTRFYDEALDRAGKAGIEQVVILAAGIDARSFRLRWPRGTRIFEVDQPEVHAYKQARLAGWEAKALRIPVEADLAADWGLALGAAGFDGARPSAWLVEGLLQYLEDATVESLLAGVTRLAAPGSVLLCDLLGGSLLEAAPLQPTLDYMRKLGAPWRFGSDDPEGLLGPRWRATPVDPGDFGRSLNRWPFPPSAGGPRGYLIEARKLG